MSAEMIHGDALEVLRGMATASVDAVVTDPPYGINTKSDGSGKLNPWADLTNAAFWYREWIGECRRVVRPAGCLWSCLNWRSLVTFQKASCDLGWPIESLLVWDKKWIGPGGSRGLRPSYELVSLWCGSDFAIADRGLADVQAFPASSFKTFGHPAEKPESLMRWLVKHSGARIVLDPFAGSGTTGAACIALGVDFIGVETDERWHGVATQRIADAQAQLSLGLGAA
ncbi:MAG: site-specific DNA-methyltransferase [Acidimicrobiia bacterium]|nr:MAG: site-specific DNA-methyltransferase [Acidimicrobiia bacterium]